MGQVLPHADVLPKLATMMRHGEMLTCSQAVRGNWSTGKEVADILGVEE